MAGVRAGLTNGMRRVGSEERRMLHFAGVEQVSLQDMLERRKGAFEDEHGRTTGRMIEAGGNRGEADPSEEKGSKGILNGIDKGIVRGN